MKNLSLLLILIAIPLKAFSFEWAAEYGQGFYETAPSETISQNYLFSVRLQKTTPSLWTYGLGYQQQKLNLTFSEGLISGAKLVSHSVYAYLSPRWQISNNFDISLENKIILNEAMQSGIDSEQRFFSGVGIGFSQKSLDYIDYRVALNVNQGLDFSANTTLALLSLELKFKSPPKRTPAAIIPPTEPITFPTPLPKAQDVNLVKIGTVVSQFGYKQNSVTLDENLKTTIQKIKSSTYEKIVVIGHTDTVGPQEYNYKLGLKRATFIKELLTKEGITGDIEVRSKGKLQPISDQDDKNRRVEIFLELNSNLEENHELLQTLQESP